MKLTEKTKKILYWTGGGVIAFLTAIVVIKKVKASNVTASPAALSAPILSDASAMKYARADIDNGVKNGALTQAGQLANYSLSQYKFWTATKAFTTDNTRAKKYSQYPSDQWFIAHKYYVDTLYSGRFDGLNQPKYLL